MGIRIRTGAGARRPLVLVSAGALAVMLLGAVALSPLALRALSAGGGWSASSDLGQAYGGISAVLSALALAGVVVTVFVQRGEARASRNQARRTFHHDLIKMAMDDPRLREVWGPSPYVTHDERRQTMYVNLVLSFWEMNRAAGVGSDESIRDNAHQMLRGEIGRKYWKIYGQERMAGADTKWERRAHRIIDEEYRKLEAAGVAAIPPPEPANDAAPQQPHTPTITATTAITAVTATATIAATTAVATATTAAVVTILLRSRRR